MTAAPPRIRFNESDANQAWEDWGCNCGPSSLAAALGLTLEQVRPHLRDFEQKRYMSPTMMKSALASLGVRWCSDLRSPWCSNGLVRIQWGGPWLQPGVPIAARYRHTHWVASRLYGGHHWVFDVNIVNQGGWARADAWAGYVAPWIIRECVRRGDGTWYPTHRWNFLEAA